MEVLSEVWSLREATARDVHDRIRRRRRIAYTTIMTVLKNLTAKAFLRCDCETTAYVYSPGQPADEVRASILVSVVEKVFDGSSSDLVRVLVRHTPVSDQDRAVIRSAIASRPPSTSVAAGNGSRSEE